MSTVSPRKRKAGEPAWEVATLYPNQGSWDEWDYLALANNTNHLLELSDGFLEVLPMPTTSHQRIVLAFCEALRAFVRPRKLGEALVAALPVRTHKGTYREPDVLFMLAENSDRIGEQYWQGADLVMEVVSPGKENRERDFKEKRKDYARGRIQEYWIIDPKEENILVLKLGKRGYVVHGEFGRGEQATSVLLDGFEIDVSAVLDAE